VARQFPEDNLFPDEILKHLRWRFNEISFYVGASKLDVLGASAEDMHDMAELMEEGHHIVVR